MAIKITENGVVRYENEPNIDRELFPNTTEGVSSEHIAEAVADWLEDHPEAVAPVQDVQVNSTSVVSNGVANVPIASPTSYGVVKSGTISVSGTTPNINTMPDVRYVCGEVSTLDITLPESGIVDVVFTSGSTPTVLTITPPTGQTVKWANGFDPVSLEADTTYEINIMDGLGVATGWA